MRYECREMLRVILATKSTETRQGWVYLGLGRTSSRRHWDRMVAASSFSRSDRTNGQCSHAPMPRLARGDAKMWGLDAAAAKPTRGSLPPARSLQSIDSLSSETFRHYIWEVSAAGSFRQPPSTFRMIRPTSYGPNQSRTALLNPSLTRPSPSF